MAQLKMSIIMVVMTTFMVMSYPCMGEEWAKTTKLDPLGKSCQTILKFYLHDIMSPGPYTSAKAIAKADDTATSPTGFGLLVMSDDRLTVGPMIDSTLVGQGQGMWGFDGRDKPSLVMDMSFTFKDGMYAGSSVTLVGNNPAYIEKNREVAVAGGTGLFRMARGYALLSTYSFDAVAGDAVIGYNITLYHSCDAPY